MLFSYYHDINLIHIIQSSLCGWIRIIPPFSANQTIIFVFFIITGFLLPFWYMISFKQLHSFLTFGSSLFYILLLLFRTLGTVIDLFNRILYFCTGNGSGSIVLFSGRTTSEGGKRKFNNTLGVLL